MLDGLKKITKGLSVGALAVVGMLVVVDYCDAGRGGGGHGGGGHGGGGHGGGGHGGGGGYGGGGHGGGAHVDNGFHHRPGDGGNYHRPGGGDHDGGGHGGGDHNYYNGWDHPNYGYGTGAALAVGAFVYSLPPNCMHATYGGLTYRNCGNVWYQPQYEDSGVHYVVVNRPY